MNVFASTFWGEGVSDERFLPVLAQRVIEHILIHCAQGQWEVNDPIVLKTQENSFVQQVLDISKQSVGYNIMFIHTDSDADDENQRAIPNKINPAINALAGVPAETHCKHIVPMIPVNKVENWKLADGEALRTALGIPLTNDEMGININANTLEQRGSSKEMLEAIIRLARSKSRYAPDLEDLDASLSKNIRIEVLLRHKSFSLFVNRLKESLQHQNIIDPGCAVL